MIVIRVTGYKGRRSEFRLEPIVRSFSLGMRVHGMRHGLLVTLTRGFPQHVRE
jgi:hypothetical protein